MTPLFPFADFWWFYATFSGFILILLLIDLGVFHKSAHAMSVKEATTWTLIWIGLAALFALGLHEYSHYLFITDPRFTSIPGFNAVAEAKRLTLEFVAGYVVEESLSVDNVFIFIVLFKFFGIPPHLQRPILFYGVIGAIVFRGLFIALGAVLLNFHAIVVIFGVLLILTGFKLMLTPEKQVDFNRHPVIRLIRKVLPVSPEFDGAKFFTRRGKKLYVTPLFVTLLFVEFTDLVFAFDSIPAIFALTSEPLIVFTSNVFAILGLRSLFFVGSAALEKFHLLKYGLGVVLMFVGAKMAYLNEAFGGKFPIGWSLAIIIGTLGFTVILSLLIPPKGKKSEA